MQSGGLGPDGQVGVASDPRYCRVRAAPSGEEKRATESCFWLSYRTATQACTGALIRCGEVTKVALSWAFAEFLLAESRQCEEARGALRGRVVNGHVMDARRAAVPDIAKVFACGLERQVKQRGRDDTWRRVG